MFRPHLIQRLLKPFENAAAMKGQTSVDMVFGGARDLDQTQHDALSKLFRLDNMGSAHFEFGALPNAIYSMTQKKMRAYEMDIAATPGPLVKQYKLKSKTAPVFVIASPDMLDDIKKFITDEATGKDHDLKRASEFQFAFFEKELGGKTSFRVNAKGICGWFDIENDYMFFLDRAMFDRVREAFEVPGDVIALKLPEPTRVTRKKQEPSPQKPSP